VGRSAGFAIRSGCCLLGCATRCVNFFADGVATDYQFHAAILLATFQRVGWC
jgi:hypothetical protein